MPNQLPSAAFTFQGELISRAISHGMESGFSRPRRPNHPWIEGLLLICPGGIVGGWGSHRCQFVSVDNQWCFEHELVVADVIERGKNGMQSITILQIEDGMLVEAVAARSRGATHTLVEAVGWRIENATLVPFGRRRGGKYPILESHRL